MKRWVGLAAWFAACMWMNAASAQNTLKIGMVAGFTGPVAGIVQESADDGVLAAPCLEHQAGHAEQVRDVGDGGALAGLGGVQGCRVGDGID